MASTYNVATYRPDNNRIEQKNLIVAAVFIARLLESSGIAYALMGGLGMKLRGSSRETFNVDILASVSVKRLWDVLVPQPRSVKVSPAAFLSRNLKRL